MVATYTPISREEMEVLMASEGFTEADKPLSVERVYHKVWRQTTAYTLRVEVYSTIHKYRHQSRSSGEDAIRTVMILEVPGRKTKVVRKHKRVHRTQHWRKNLLSRLQTLGQLDPPECPDCRMPMVLRSGKNGDFWGCSEYPKCRRTEGV